MISNRRAAFVLAIAVLVALAFGPAIGNLVNIDTSFLAEVLLTAIAAMSVNLLLGYIGLPAFGCAAFFGARNRENNSQIGFLPNWNGRPICANASGS